jgi:NADH-quinone oxidoreductase subunit A
MIFLLDYYIIFVAFFLTFLLGGFLILIPWFFSPRVVGNEKRSIYECGFDPFESARIKFDIQFYILAILFILFDVELIYLLPWALSVGQLGYFAYNVVLLFFLIIVGGFYYEWLKNALDWVTR